MAANYELLIEERFQDHAAGASVSVFHASSTIIDIALSLIRENGGDIDQIAEAAGKVLTGIAKAFDIPYVPEFIEERIEAMLIARAVATIKLLGRKQSL